MKRREFLTHMAGGVTAAGLAVQSLKPADSAQGIAAPLASTGKRHHIAVSTWSLHNYFPSTREKEFTLPGEMLELLEFPEMVADCYKVHHLEFCAPHFASTEPSYLKELKSRLKKSRSHLVNMPVDIKELWSGGGLSDSDGKVRTAALSGAKKWIDIGSEVGTRSVRCDPGRMSVQNLAPTVESYKELAASGKSKGVYVTIENHGGVGSEHPEELVKLFQEVGSEFCGALPDFANFPDEPTRQKGLELLFPHAQVLCHAKGLEFDSNGNETKFDFPKCMEIAKKSGFTGVYSIEFEGPGDPYAGVQKTLDELLRYL